LQAAPQDIISVLNDAPHRQEQREIEHLQEQNKFLRKTLRQVRNHCEQLTAGNKERNEHFAVQFNKMRQISEEMEETHARELGLKDEDLLQQRITMEAGFQQRLEDQKVAQDKDFHLEKLGLQEEINRLQSECELTRQEKQAVTSMWQETKNRLRKYEQVDEIEGDTRKVNMGGSCYGPQPIRGGEPSTGRKFATGFKKMFFN
jgi:prefoldin subunit 5